MKPPRWGPANAGVVECTVRGCGWRAEIPSLSRIVVDELDVGTHGDPVSRFMLTRVEPDPEGVAAFEAYLAGHLEQHALVETLVGEQRPPSSALEGIYRATTARLHPDDPGPVEP